MSRYTVVVAGVALLTGFSLACTSNSSAPLAPTTATSSSSTASAAADGSTLKVSAPVPVSPVGGQQLTTAPTLTANGSTATFGSTPALQYRFQGFDPANTLVQDSGLVASPSFAVTATLQASVAYTWRARAEYQGSVGPWSTTPSFVAPVPPPAVLFDHPWAGNVELALRALLASGLAGADGLNGDAVVAQMNTLGGIYAGAEFQQQHDGPGGYPTYGFGWFYVSYVPIGNGTGFYQIVEFGAPPAGD